jgi:hypothetical protein
MRTRPTDVSRPDWLMLILSVPGQQPALRVRMWRKLRALGVGALRDGVYLAPNRADLRDALRSQVDEVGAAGGTAQLLEVGLGDDDFGYLFDRSEEYRTLTAAIKGRMMRRGRRAPASAARTFEQLQREFDAIVQRDFFPGLAQNDARRALDEFRIQLERLRTPDEPHAAHGRISRLDKADYQGRTWITREHPWVDRLASAWLIRRFIDPGAKIRWVKSPLKRTGNALGFDFDGAAFTHVDEKVTFEILMESFDLEQDSALVRIAGIVHYLDVGGFLVPESAVVEAALRGMQKRARNDDLLFERASEFLDDLHAGYSKPSARVSRSSKATRRSDERGR